MSEPVRIGLVGATGLVGRRIMETCVGAGDVRLVGISRREAELPEGARMEMYVADPSEWGDVLETVKPTVLINALGSTWRKSGKDEAAFRAVDHDLVLDTARAAQQAGVERFVSISAAGAAATSKNFYLKVKGETDRELRKLKFKRVDILRPGLLKGPRKNDLRPVELLGMVLSPLINPFLSGKYSGFRAIDARLVAEAALGLAIRKAAGKFTHDNAGIGRAARDWNQRKR